MQVIKKDGRIENYDFQKIKQAVTKSAARLEIELTSEQWLLLENQVKHNLSDKEQITVAEMHSIVERTLNEVIPAVGQAYSDYRNYKKDYANMMTSVLNSADELNYKIDRSNANTTAALISTQRSLIFTALSKEIYKKLFLSKDELKIIHDGYIYIHDLGSRAQTYNCFGRDTTFITSEGIRSFMDFNDGDIIYVPSHTGQIRKAIVRNYGPQQLNRVVFKRCGQGYHEVRVTDNHRWILKDGSETTHLKVGDKIKLAPDMKQSLEKMTINQCRAFAHGFALGDGVQQTHTNPSGNIYSYTTVRLCGNKNRYSTIFLSAGYNVTYPLSYSGDGSVYIGDFLKNSFNRDSFKNYSYDELQAMAYGYMCADGHKTCGANPSSEFRGVQITGCNDWIEDLLTIGGFYITNRKDLTNQTTNYGQRKNKTISYQLHNNQGCRGYVVQSIQSDVVEDVWCLEVDEDHSFILEKGLVCGNCCLFDMGAVLQGGFEWEHIGYNEPKDVRTAGNLISDITLNCAAQQYGGFTIPEVDSILAPYARKTYNKYMREYKEIVYDNFGSYDYDTAHKYSIKRLTRDIEQVFQGFEHTFNTVASSRGDYPFVTMTGGCEEDEFGQLIWKTALQVRRKGQGKPGHRRPAIFPKLVFLYTEKLHDQDKPMHYLFEEAVKTSAIAMYPDYLSLDMPDESLIKDAATMHFEPAIAKVFHKYHKFGESRWLLDENENVYENINWRDSIISPMGK